MPTHKERIIGIMENTRGDNLERARMAFARFTPEQMQEEHGESGSTRADLLAAYEAGRIEFNELMAWAKDRIPND